MFWPNPIFELQCILYVTAQKTHAFRDEKLFNDSVSVTVHILV